MIAGIIGLLAPLTQSNAAAALTVSPSSAPVGATVQVLGSNLPSKAQVQLVLDGSPTGLPTLRVSRDGSLKARFVVPVTSPGPHTLGTVSMNRAAGPGRAAYVLGAVLAVGTLTVTAPVGATEPAPSPSQPPVASAAPTATPASSPAPTLPPGGAIPSPPSTPAPTPPPTPTPSPAPSQIALPGQGGFVTACGTSLCLGGARFPLYGASVFNGLDNPAQSIESAVAANLNTVRVVNFLYEFDPIEVAAYRERDWSRLDRFIALAGQARLRVLLDLSTYRNLLRENGLNPYSQDWGPWLSWVANRVNTVTGVAYRDDPTIALISLAGEPEPIAGNPDPLAPDSSAQLTDFYARSAHQLREADPNHLISSGGLLQYGWDSGIDWRAIFHHVDVCALHGYSASDVAAVSAVAAYCASLGKPWIAEEFGYQQVLGDPARAQAFQAIFDMVRANQSAGVGFWNLGPEVADGSHDVNPLTPVTWETIRANAWRQ